MKEEGRSNPKLVVVYSARQMPEAQMIKAILEDGGVPAMVGDEALDLSGVSFDKGVTFAFAGSSVTTLGPGKFVLVVKNKQAFLSRYGSALSGLIAGEYLGKLANEDRKVTSIAARRIARSAGPSDTARP